MKREFHSLRRPEETRRVLASRLLLFPSLLPIVPSRTHTRAALDTRTYMEFVAREAEAAALEVLARGALGDAFELLRIVDEHDHPVEGLENSRRVALQKQVRSQHWLCESERRELSPLIKRLMTGLAFLHKRIDLIYYSLLYNVSVILLVYSIYSIYCT